jgi:effector-binding domain-containing protein
MPEEEIAIKLVPTVHALAMRRVVAGTSGIPPFLTDAFAAVGMKGIEPAGPPLTIYHDLEFDPAAIDVEVVVPVAPGVHGPVPTPAGRELMERTLEPMTVASLVHVGSYESLGGSYQALEAWIGEHGYEIAGPPQEIYLTGPQDPGPPVTEVRWPVRRH